VQSTRVRRTLTDSPKQGVQSMIIRRNVSFKHPINKWRLNLQTITISWVSYQWWIRLSKHFFRHRIKKRKEESQILSNYNHTNQITPRSISFLLLVGHEMIGRRGGRNFWKQRQGKPHTKSVLTSAGINPWTWDVFEILRKAFNLEKSFNTIKM